MCAFSGAGVDGVAIPQRGQNARQWSEELRLMIALNAETVVI